MTIHTAAILRTRAAIAGAIMLATIFLEDTQETLAHHSGGIFGGWWYAENRWRTKYINPDGPYTMANRKWWSRYGFGAFIDLWHTAKTLRVWLFLYLLVNYAGLTWWWTIPGWFLYGTIHDRILYGNLLK